MARPTRFGSKWRIRWMDECRKRSSAVFFTYEEADLALKQAEAAVAEIRQGLRAPRPADRSFGELCDYWLANRAPLKRSSKDDESMIRAHLRLSFGTVLLRDFGQMQVDAYRASRRSLSDKTVHNHLTLTVAMLNAAVDIGWLHKAPRVRKPRVRAVSADYRFLKTDREVERFLQSAMVEGDMVHALYATAIGTGMRAGELAGLRWSCVNFERRLITVEKSFDGPTKGGDVRYVPILDSVLTILRQWRLKQPGDIVFPNQDGRMQGPSARVFQEVLHRVLQRAGFKPGARSGRMRHYITFHDLRHTFASLWMMNGSDLFKLQKILGHKSVQMTLRYAHLQPDAFSDDYHHFGCLAPSSSGQLVELPLPEGRAQKASGDGGKLSV